MISEAGLAVLIVILAYLIMRFMRYEGTYYCLAEGKMMKVVIKHIPDENYYVNTLLPEFEKKADFVKNSITLGAKDFATDKWYSGDVHELFTTGGIEDYKYYTTLIMRVAQFKVDEKNMISGDGILTSGLTTYRRLYQTNNNGFPRDLFLNGLTWWFADTMGQTSNCSKDVL